MTDLPEKTKPWRGLRKKPSDRPDVASLKIAVRALQRARKNLACQPLATGDLTPLLDRLDKLVLSTMRTLEMVVSQCPQQIPSPGRSRIIRWRSDQIEMGLIIFPRAHPNVR